MAESVSNAKHFVSKSIGDTSAQGINGGDSHGKYKPKRNYKLLIDPAIKKGHQKIYRFEGVLSGKPPIIPRDPRPPRTKLWTATVAELPIPRFKVDKYYVGNLPENTVRFGCLNDNINRQFLRELCLKFGKIEECKVYYDIKSKKHLGTGKITFSTPSAARQAVSELDGSSVMGNIIRVSIERKKNRNRTMERQASSGHSSKDPREFRDPRRSISSGSSAAAVLPTPSPSQYSPSVESTPPTPLVSAMNRPHPVAILKHGQYQRRGDSIDNDITPLESPLSISSTSFKSATFEPVSPPATVRMRSSSSDSLSFPPPPPPDRSSDLPPPPPPSKQGIYEDISPTANFDDENKSPFSEKRKNVRKDLGIEEGKGTFVQAHLLGLKIACRGESSSGIGRQDMTLCNNDGSENQEAKQRRGRCRSPSNERSRGTYNVEYETPNASEKYNKKSERTPNYNEPFRTELGMNYDLPKSRNNLSERKCRAELEINLDMTKKSNNDTVYEAISDSDDDGGTQKTQLNTAKNLQVEDISPVDSPVGKNSFNGLGLVKPNDDVVIPEKSGASNDEASKATSAVNNDGNDDDNADDGDDDDAMSLSSISSNEESSLVLNTPAVPVATPNNASSFQNFANQPAPFVHTRPNLTIHPGHATNIVPRPPVNIAAPPHVAPPSQINMQPVNVHQQPRQPPINVQQPPVMTHLPPPPPVNIHIPPPRIGFNQSIPPPPYRPPGVQPPQIRTAQAPPSYPPKSTGGGFLPSFSRPYQGFFSGNYQNYRDINMNQGRQVAAVVKEIPYEEKVKDFCVMKTRKDLKAVLHRDLIKRLVEHSGFSALELWWDNQTKKKNSSLAMSRPTVLPHASTSQVKVSHIESPSSSTTSSLLMSLFGRTQTSSSSSLNFQSPTRIHGPISKIPSFRISRIPQTRPLGREVISRKLKREGKSSELEVVNKLRKLSPEEDEEERTVKEEESDSESDSEAERRLLASRRSTVKSGSSLYQTIYESSEIDDSDEDEKSDDEDEEFQELIHQQQKLRKEQMRKIEEKKRVEGKEEEGEEDDEDEEMLIKDKEEERSSDEEEMDEDEDVVVDEEEEMDEDDDEEEEMDEDDDEEEESEDSEWESSGAEAAVQEVIRETEKRLELFKEESAKKEDKKEKVTQRNSTANLHLTRADKGGVKKEEESIEREKLMSDRAKHDLVFKNKVERGPEELKIEGNFKETTKSLEVSKILSIEKEHLHKRSEMLNKVVEETIEETEILSKDAELDGSDVKEELISEEVIEIEPEGEVLNEHSYAFTSSYEKQESNQLKEEEVMKVKEKPPSPVIDVVNINDDKDLVSKRHEPKAIFPMRSIDHENSIVWNVLREGIDSEDLKYLQTAFESLHVFGSNVVKDHHWSHHPETLVPSKQRRARGEPLLRVHNTGSARSEGYYKIPLSEKSQYLSSVMRQLETKDETNEKDSDGLKHKQQSRENRAMQRRLISSFVNDDFGDLVKFNKLKSRKKKLKFAKSGIHNWGLFTCEPIAAEEMVIEYVGEIVRSVIADAREKHYEKTGIGSSYLFRLDAETVIDATKIGNNARFINHSCAPNCYAKIINVENEKKIVIYSKYDIKMNDEITYDYKFPIEEVKIQCLCGTPQCRGTLN